MKMLTANPEKLRSVEEAGRALGESGHPEKTQIDGRVKELRDLWEELNELTSARQDVSFGGRI